METAEEMYWEPEIETMPANRLRDIQEERLLRLVEYVYTNTNFYKRKFDEAGLSPGNITSLEDLSKLPLTRYIEDFAATSIEDKLAVDWDDVTEIMTTSGTISGTTLPVMMTEKDVEQGFNLFARVARMTGMRPDDIVQMLMPWDVSVPTIKKLASKVLPCMAGRMILDEQIKLAKAVKSTVIFGMPSYILMFVNRAKDLGIDIRKDTSLRLALMGGEPLSAPVRERLRNETGIDFHDMYGFAEVMGIGGECSMKHNLHIWADHYILEVVDIDTSAPLGPGEMGELVITTLTKEAMPLVRYKTGDVTMILDNGACQCGRTHPRIAPVKGRVFHMIKVDGRVIFPIDIDNFITKDTRLCNEFRIIVDKPDVLDLLKLKVEYKPGVANLSGLKEELEDALMSEISLKNEIELLPEGSLVKTQFKAQRIVKTYQQDQ